MNPFVRLSLATYRRLAYAYPQEFQMVYGTDVIRLGEDAIESLLDRLKRLERERVSPLGALD
jgi:hypothetical protein